MESGDVSTIRGLSFRAAEGDFALCQGSERARGSWGMPPWVL
jgi:hypothetical protein